MKFTCVCVHACVCAYVRVCVKGWLLVCTRQTCRAARAEGRLASESRLCFESRARGTAPEVHDPKPRCTFVFRILLTRETLCRGLKAGGGGLRYLIVVGNNSPKRTPGMRVSGGPKPPIAPLPGGFPHQESPASRVTALSRLPAGLAAGVALAVGRVRAPLQSLSARGRTSSAREVR